MTIQIPFELQVCDPEKPNQGPSPPCPPGIIATVVEDGVAGEQFIDLVAVPTGVHIVRACDIMAVGSTSLRSCEPLILRADGRLITTFTPARAGEVLSVFAVGLGPTSPAVPSGSPSPFPPARLVLPLSVSFNFNPDASPLTQANAFGEVLFAGLAPGFVGLYQVNFKLPEEIPQGARPCGGLSPNETNMTLMIFGASGSFDATQICARR